MVAVANEGNKLRECRNGEGLGRLCEGAEERE